MIEKLITEAINDTIETSDKWVGAKYELIKRANTTHKGKFGENLGIKIGNMLNIKSSRNSNEHDKFDIFYNGKLVEVKTATLDVNGYFQFNGVRKVRNYDYILCVGVMYNDILFEIFDKSYVLNNFNLSAMDSEQDGNGSFKLTINPKRLLHFDDFKEKLTRIFKCVI